MKLSAIGQSLPGGGQQIATENAHAICAAASAAGTCVTLDMEDHTTIDSTLETLRGCCGRISRDRRGAAVLPVPHRRGLPGPGDFWFAGPAREGRLRRTGQCCLQSRAEVDLNYVRCLKVLLAGDGYPMVATHDPRLIEIAEALAVRAGRSAGEYEYQLLLGVRPDEQRRLNDHGERVRVYVPYGAEWYGYLVRRMAEKPANLGLLLRSLTSTK